MNWECSSPGGGVSGRRSRPCARRLSCALAHFRRSLRLRPQNAEVRFNLGLALYRLGRLGEAQGAFREVLRRRPGDPGARELLARLEAHAEGKATGAKGMEMEQARR